MVIILSMSYTVYRNTFVMELPYPKNALEPFLSEQTLTFHYEKHHKGYEEALKKQIDLKDGDLLETIILDHHVAGKSAGSPVARPIFNAAAQIWNHNFYWNSLTTDTLSQPNDALTAVIARTFGTLKALEEALVQGCMTQFGSGWCWLVSDPEGNLSLEKTGNAELPIGSPLLVVDVWEHAYYLDYQNRRLDYSKSAFQYLNWNFAAIQYWARHEYFMLSSNKI